MQTYREESRCQPFLVILNEKLIKANTRHLEDLKNVNRYITKNILKNKIENSENCYNIKLKKMYDDILLKNEETEYIPNFVGIKSNYM